MTPADLAAFIRADAWAMARREAAWINRPLAWIWWRLVVPRWVVADPHLWFGIIASMGPPGARAALTSTEPKE